MTDRNFNIPVLHSFIRSSNLVTVLLTSLSWRYVTTIGSLLRTTFSGPKLKTLWENKNKGLVWKSCSKAIILAQVRLHYPITAYATLIETVHEKQNLLSVCAVISELSIKCLHISSHFILGAVIIYRRTSLNFISDIARYNFEQTLHDPSWKRFRASETIVKFIASSDLLLSRIKKMVSEVSL